MIRQQTRSTPLYSSAASDVYKRQDLAIRKGPQSLGANLYRPQDRQAFDVGQWRLLDRLAVPVLHLQSHSPDAYSHSVFLCQNMDTVIPWWPDCPGFQLPGRGFRGWRLCPLVVDLVRQANGLQ